MKAMACTTQEHGHAPKHKGGTTLTLDPGINKIKNNLAEGQPQAIKSTKQSQPDRGKLLSMTNTRYTVSTQTMHRYDQRSNQDS